MKTVNRIAFAFDLDGTLVDTEEYKALSHKEAIKYFGGEITSQSYYDLIGNSFQYVYKDLINEAKLDIPFINYKNIFNQLYVEKLNHQILLENGVYDLLEKLFSMNIKMALVTSSEKWMMDLIVKKAGIKNYFEILISGDDVIHNKPNPEPYQKAIKRLNSKNTFVFEDSEPGIISANKAGAITFGIKNKYNSIDDLRLAKKIYNNFGEVNLDQILSSF